MPPDAPERRPAIASQAWTGEPNPDTARGLMPYARTPADAGWILLGLVLFLGYLMLGLVTVAAALAFLRGAWERGLPLALAAAVLGALMLLGHRIRRRMPVPRKRLIR